VGLAVRRSPHPNPDPITLPILVSREIVGHAWLSDPQCPPKAAVCFTPKRMRKGLSVAARRGLPWRRAVDSARHPRPGGPGGGDLIDFTRLLIVQWSLSGSQVYDTLRVAIGVSLQHNPMVQSSTFSWRPKDCGQSGGVSDGSARAPCVRFRFRENLARLQPRPAGICRDRWSCRRDKELSGGGASTQPVCRQNGTGCTPGRPRGAACSAWRILRPCGNGDHPLESSSEERRCALKGRLRPQHKPIWPPDAKVPVVH